MARSRSKSNAATKSADSPMVAAEESDANEESRDPIDSSAGDSWLERLRPLTMPLGSLEVAVILLAVWATALVLGTLVESWYDAAAAGELVYSTWWFRLLLGLLAANILCAALKKWPWKRHQLGFLITHVGLLTLVTAGAWSAAASTSGVMTLVDSPAADGPPDGWHTADIAIDRRQHVLRIQRADQPPESALVAPFQPGVLGWKANGEPLAPPDDRAAAFLQLAATPWPRDWSWTTDDGARLSVLAYYPQAEVKPFRQAAVGERGFPAIGFELISPQLGTLPVTWVADVEGVRTLERGAGKIEFVGAALSPEQVHRFLTPAISPAGDEALRGLLQFATDDQGRLHYRSFHRPAAKQPAAGLAAWEFEGSGQIAASDPAREIWRGMQWRLRIAEFLRHAAPGPWCEPFDRPLGVEDMQHPPAVLCRLEQGNARREFWLTRTDEGSTEVPLAGQTYLVGLHPRWFELDFALTLDRAEQTLDPGTSRPASQTSHVLLTDPGEGLERDPRTIELNEPLAHRGYKFYQSNFRILGRDDAGRSVSQVQLVVGYDPASYLKYAGAAIVSLGIACMFYMRAYALTTIDLPWEPSTRNADGECGTQNSEPGTQATNAEVGMRNAE